MEHTALPWRQKERYIMALKEKRVAELPSGGILHGKIDEANAAYIVRACNSFENLLTALKATKAHFDWETDATQRKWTCRDQRTYEQVEAAITRAEGRE